MKTIHILSLLIAFSLLIACQPNEAKKPSGIPEEVTQSFKSQNPEIEDVQWEKDGEYYEAEFMENGREKAFVYDAKGEVVAAETEIAAENLLPSILEYIKNNFQAYQIEEAEEISMKGEKKYEVELKEGASIIELVFDGNGSYLGEEKEDGEEEEEENDEE